MGIPPNQTILPHEEPENPFTQFRDQVVTALDAFAQEQTKINRALFAALTPEQRDKFVQACADQGMKTPQIQLHTAKSQPTINRHKNGHNS